MAAVSLESRVAALEAEVARLKAKIEGEAAAKIPWWEKIYGSFTGDPIYKDAMQLGRAYRESLRPKPRKSRKKRDGGA